MNFLAQIAVGPVQGFIATARRSRDLWFGSFILSELSKSAASHLLDEKGAQLVFPHAKNPGEAFKPDSPAQVTNIVLCELEAETLSGAVQVVSRTKSAIECRWNALCAGALDDIKRRDPKAAIHFYDDGIWNAQLSDVVEVFTAIVRQTDERDGYKTANDELRALMACRKNTRNFVPYRDDFTRRKSSLDGAQSNVLQEPTKARHPAHAARLRHMFGIEPAECLDASALVKRVLGRGRVFVPSARVAAHEWILRAKAADSTIANGFNKVTKLHATLAKQDFSTALVNYRYAEYPWIKEFPFDAQLLYAHRVDAEKLKLADLYPDSNDIATRDEIETALNELSAELGRVYRHIGAPTPYYGLLLADGDRMGKLIDRATSADQHREISLALSRFAEGVARKMSALNGACIYSGGDDVLGLVPLHATIDTADALRLWFGECLDPVAEANDLPRTEWPTLSVGVALVHFLEPLGDARTLATRAEKLAKGEQLPVDLQRNAIAVIGKPRAGPEIAIRIPWPDTNALKRLKDWTTRFRPGCKNDPLPRGLPNELATVFENCRRTFDPTDESSAFAVYWRTALAAVLKRKRADGAFLGDSQQADLVEQLAADDWRPSRRSDPFDPLRHLAMARWLAGITEAQS